LVKVTTDIRLVEISVDSLAKKPDAESFFTTKVDWESELMTASVGRENRFISVGSILR